MPRARIYLQLALLIVCISFATGTLAQELVWSSYEGISGDTFSAGTTDSSGNVYLAGRTGSTLLVEKISANGVTVDYRVTFPATAPFTYSFTVQDIKVDSTGNAYLVGGSSTNFPITTSNAFQTSAPSGTHALIVVLSPTGVLTYASYLAGTTSATDQANGVAVDSTGDAYVTGYTNSTTFPTTTGALQTTNPSGQQAGWVAKISTTAKTGLASLVYSTYLNGPTTSSEENTIAIDSAGDAYVTGGGGTDFPTTKGAFAYDGEGLGSGSPGVYVTKLNPTGTALVYSAFLGIGTGSGIAVDASDLAYVTGTVNVNDFPTTSGAFQVTYPSGFASQLNAAGSALNYSTFLGAAEENTTPQGIAIEPGCTSPCNAFIVGFTNENDLTLVDPIQSFNASYVTVDGALEPGNDFFVTELNAKGTAAVFSTFIGGSSDESDEAGTAHSPAIAVTSTGDAYVIGGTESSNFPVTLTTNPQRPTVALEIAPAAGVTAVAFPL